MDLYRIQKSSSNDNTSEDDCVDCAVKGARDIIFEKRGKVTPTMMSTWHPPRRQRELSQRLLFAQKLRQHLFPGLRSHWCHAVTNAEVKLRIFSIPQFVITVSEGRHAVIVQEMQSLRVQEDKKMEKNRVNYWKTLYAYSLELLLVTCLLLLQHHKINICRTVTNIFNMEMKNDHTDSLRNQFCQRWKKRSIVLLA